MITTNITASIVNGTDANGTNTTTDIAVVSVLAQIFCWLVISSGVIGNVLVLIVFISRWNRLMSYEVFIISLALADLMGSIMLPSIQIHEVSGACFKGIGTGGCKVVHLLAHASVCVSALTLIMVSIDRYIAVKWPYKDRKYIYRSMIVVAWVLGISSAVITSYQLQLYKEEEGTRWVCRIIADKATVTVIVLVVFSIRTVIPIIVMSIVYRLVVYELYKSSYNLKHHMTEEERHLRSVGYQKTTRLLTVVVVVFFICVTPSSVFYMLYHFGAHQLPTHYIYPVHVMLTMLMMSNSCVNPLIYGQLHRSFRTRTKRFFTSCFSIKELYKRRASTYNLANLIKKRSKSDERQSLTENTRYQVDLQVSRKEPFFKKISNSSTVKMEVQNMLEIIKTIRQDMEYDNFFLHTNMYGNDFGSFTSGKETSL